VVCRGCVREYSPNDGIAFRTSSAIRALVSKRLPHLVFVPSSGLSHNSARSSGPWRIEKLCSGKTSGAYSPTKARRNWT
jgi:hypothetical protein